MRKPCPTVLTVETCGSNVVHNNIQHELLKVRSRFDSVASVQHCVHLVAFVMRLRSAKHQGEMPMKVRIVLLCAIVMSMSSASAQTLSGKLVGRLMPPDGRDCVFFELQGVGTADPSVPGGESWIAVPRSQTGFKEIYALLLTAKAMQMPITVVTTGAPAPSPCNGFVGLTQIYSSE